MSQQRDRQIEGQEREENKEHSLKRKREDQDRPVTCCCRWLPADSLQSTERSFEVWLSAHHSGACGEEPGSERTFRWQITCEKHIPFCLKKLSGRGRLKSSAGGRTAVNVDLSRSGYGLVTLAVALDGTECDAVNATTVREVCTNLPEGRSMTRTPTDFAKTDTGTESQKSEGASLPSETWAGEHRWHEFGARKIRQQLATDASTSTSLSSLVPISSEELARHRSVGDGWVAVRGLVFDVSEFLSYHPGGVRTLMGVLGIDATDQFEAVHPQVDANAVMGIGGCVKGRLVSEQTPSA